MGTASELGVRGKEARFGWHGQHFGGQEALGLAEAIFSVRYTLWNLGKMPFLCSGADQGSMSLRFRPSEPSVRRGLEKAPGKRTDLGTSAETPNLENSNRS